MEKPFLHVDVGWLHGVTWAFLHCIQICGHIPQTNDKDAFHPWPAGLASEDGTRRHGKAGQDSTFRGEKRDSRAIKMMLHCNIFRSNSDILFV